LNKAVSLADKASEGERLLILATQATDFNSLPQLNYAFIRTKARKIVT
jgi:hypothetical protein